jgi:hypothetical protein
MPYTDMAGETVTLRMFREADLPALHARLHQGGRFHDADFDEPPSLELLRKRLVERHSLTVWLVSGKGGAKCSCHIGISRFGSAVLWIDALGEIEVEPAQEAVTLVIKAFFMQYPNEFLLFHVPVEQEDEARPVLVETGFEPVYAGLDPQTHASYALTAATYKLYFES